MCDLGLDPRFLTPAQHAFFSFPLTEWLNPLHLLPTPPTFQALLPWVSIKGCQEEWRRKGDLGGLPRGGGNYSQFSSSKTNHWAPHEQVPFSHQKPPPAQNSIQMDPGFLPLISCSNQVHTRWPIGGAFVSTKLMRGEGGREREEFRERGERGEVSKREEVENWKKKETRTCHLAWKSSFQDQDCGCELGRHGYWGELRNFIGVWGFPSKFPPPLASFSEEENDFGARGNWSPVLSQLLCSLTWVSHLTFMSPNFIIY